MPTVAEQLRRAREAQNLSIHQVAEATKIKSDHIRALEEGYYKAFSAPVYIRGFVRTYAAMLRLDVPKVISALEAELAQTEEFREPPSLTGGSRGWLDFWMLQLSKIQWRLVLPTVALIALVAIVIWAFRFWRSRQVEDPLGNLGPGLYQINTNTAGQTLPLPTNLPLNKASPRR
jgi:cytoskeletal protein RodZ